jgi:tagatose-1,6-bisphosphate aldolase non-catalytic subunit AgaZ/GatZ
MTKTFTYDDVVRYLYAETTQEENALIVEALALDDDLMNFYLDALEIQHQMNRITRTPSDWVIERVLDYSCQYTINQPAELSV